LTQNVLPACLLAVSITWHPATAFAGNLDERFRRPPIADRPWAYWWWLKGNVTKEAITRDLEAMKRVGLGGLLQFDARGYNEHIVPPPKSRMDFMGPQWRELLAFSISEAQRLGLQVSVNLSSCAGSLKGPWQVGVDAPKHLIWTSATLHGPRRFEQALPRPADGHFLGDIALLAVRWNDSLSTEAHPSARSDLCGDWHEANQVATEVIDLTDRVDAQGRVRWEVPEGSWRIFRFAFATMQKRDYDVDILDTKAVNAHFDRMGRAIVADAGPAAGKTLTHFYSVSWEGATPTWTSGLDQEFQQRRGYSLRKYLPVLAGTPVISQERSVRFLRDYNTTLAELFMDHFYGTLRQRCHEAGLLWHSESGGPWEACERGLPVFAHADQQAFLARNDLPQGEFWVGQQTCQSLCKPIAMTAHIYGRPLAAAEAFTHMGQHWSEYPAIIKPQVDEAFRGGVNQLVWHTFTAEVPEFGLPGLEYFAGTHLNPNVTWFNEAGPFLTYLARCQVMLRQGHFAGDVCCYVGDSAYLHWGKSEKWGPRATRVLGKGLSYDLINTEALLSRLSVKDGKLVLPDGMSYRLLVVDLVEPTAQPQALRKIRDLARAGATVVLGTRRPARAPGLTNYPACDREVGELAAQLWADTDRPERRRLGKGSVVSGTPLDDVLLKLGVRPDFDGPFGYLHRHGDDLDVYFLTGQGQADCTFRVAGKEPEFWDPVSGEIRPAVLWRSAGGGRTIVPVQLPANGATFVVFRKPATPAHLVSRSGSTEGVAIAGGDGHSAEVVFWQPGCCEFRTSVQRQIKLDVPAVPPPQPLAGPWSVRFQAGRGGPESAVFNELTAWEKNSDPRIKFFSGTATYAKHFTLGEEQARQLVRLSLGDVKCIAHVRLNGKDLGVVWTAPWTVDLSDIARPGENQLEIDVSNLWVNRLIGDAGLPPSQRITKTNVAMVPAKHKLQPFEGFSAGDPLLPSGLLGPVRLEFGQRRQVAW
jgi:hypothetical protein